MDHRLIEGQTFDEERALYGSTGLLVRNCRFSGPADGESFLKECSDLIVEDCSCDLRYPFWHVHGLTIEGCELTEKCRAALWYSDGIKITDSKLHGIKALRECDGVKMVDCDIESPEFGWFSRHIDMRDTDVKSEYFMLQAYDLRLDNVALTGKYSFQYTRDAEFAGCNLDTKDAFWHARNVVLRDCDVKGEYLGWYSDGLTLIDCRISGTQPLCYCKNLRLVDCTMTGCDLAFEKSQVEATVTTPIDSVKNPYEGFVEAPSIGKFIMDDPHAVEAACDIRVKTVA